MHQRQAGDARRPPGRDRIGIAIEGVDGGPGIEEAAGVAASAEGCVYHDPARTGLDRFGNFVEQDRDVRRGRHARFAPVFAFDFALARWAA